ncbi:MAG: hypothetical protein BGO78_07210 [Chloroflexi bacterium 44-23]|nr:MAG: hypothetical protein BGO78_07210 [Chloroflexi bacterium 44-23]
MSKFSDWFNKAYNKWRKSQPGEEDFLAFCDLLGYIPAIVLSWFQDEITPQGAELLSIAGLFGTNFYSLLGQTEPDPELMKIYNSFSHLKGEYRGKLSQALWEAQSEMQQKCISPNSKDASIILAKTFLKWGIEDSVP